MYKEIKTAWDYIADRFFDSFGQQFGKKVENRGASCVFTLREDAFKIACRAYELMPTNGYASGYIPVRTSPSSTYWREITLCDGGKSGWAPILPVFF